MHTKVEHAEYNPGLGCITKNSKHRAEIAKRKGLVEVGNEDVSNWRKRSEMDLAAKQDAHYAEAYKDAKDMALSPSTIPRIEGPSDGSA